MAEQKLSVTDELMKLADLKEKGILTEQEFAAAKASLLRSLHASAPPEMKVCDACEGKCRCEECYGDGEVDTRKTRWVAPKMEQCEACRGTGKCRKCNGAGKIQVDRVG